MPAHVEAPQRMKLLSACFLLFELVAAESDPFYSDEDPPPSSIQFLNAPTIPVSGYPLQVLYYCPHRQIVNLDVLASSLTKLAVPVFKKCWLCGPHERDRLHEIMLDLPDWLVFREDYFIKNSVLVVDVLLRAWITDILDEPPDFGFSDSFDSSSARTFRFLQALSPYSRPHKEHKRTLCWDQELVWRLRKDRLHQCPAEQEVGHLLSFIYACSGDHFGIIRAFAPYTNPVLEAKRKGATDSPLCSFTTWLYVLRYCPLDYCGVLYHLDAQNNYASPAVLMTSSGLLHVQIMPMYGPASAFKTIFTIPLHQWCWIKLDMDGAMVNLTVACREGKTDNMVFRFSQNVFLDDTIGSFFLGGSPLVRGIEAFYGPSAFYRTHNHAPFKKSDFLLPDLLASLNLSRWYDKCRRFKNECSAKMQTFQLQARYLWQQATCSDVYTEYITRYKEVSPGPQSHEWDAPHRRQRATVSKLLNMMVLKRGDWKLNLESLGRAIHRSFETRVATREGMVRLRGLLPLLVQAGCLGFHRSFFLASVLYQTGLGLKMDSTKALRLSLIAAQSGERLSLMKMGHKHHLGVDGFPVDYDVSYGYYSNVARQTITDRVNPSRDQSFVESIRLIDDDILKQQTKENEDLFMWLRFQARQGVTSAQQAVGRMLFWGQQGISSNLKAAVKFYEKGATQLKDPVLMYDYGVVLLRGQGVKKNIPKALEFIQESANKDFVPAINSLGWYYEQYEKDYVKAVELWHKADDMGDMEAPFNLGILLSLGLYPGKPKDEFAAYTYFWKSAMRGHIDAAVHLSAFWIQGIPGAVPRMPIDAVLWSKWASEKNGYLGAILRKSLDAYLQRDWPKSILNYIQAAEAGFDAALFNMAYICELDPEWLVTRHMSQDCIMKYYNLSVHSDRPATYAQIKMGDLLYTAHPKRKRDVTTAIKMYKEAALQQDPQGLYSLGILVEEGVSLPHATLHQLGFNASARASRFTILLELYRRCRDHEKDVAYVPCSLALLNVHLQHIWMFHSSAVKFFSAATVAVITAFSIMTIVSRLQQGALRLQHTV
ncbi:protein sel-1 homolog 3-like [Ambystoma mexicanum]|uniref:protein sel-1 homolog 3-like n=1 Tax=Ambystoma mexicanum TaxID=8296 RepID=UPI0037E762BC